MLKNWEAPLLILLSSVMLTACSDGIVYSEYRQLPSKGWHADSVMSFTFDIADTVAMYDIVINVRHMDNYPYQNMWLFVELDTIEFYLADNYGNWLGNGKNGLIEMPVLYEQNYTFSHTGAHTIRLQHGMRTDWLKGVNAVGVEVRKGEGKNNELME